jgi:hypothetical protein
LVFISFLWLYIVFLILCHFVLDVELG